MRPGVSISPSEADLERLRSLVKDRNAPQKHVWRAQIVLLSAGGVGTNAIMRETGKSKTCAVLTFSRDRLVIFRSIPRLFISREAARRGRLVSSRLPSAPAPGSRNGSTAPRSVRDARRTGHGFRSGPSAPRTT
jgi:hypothetical protein